MRLAVCFGWLGSVLLVSPALLAESTPTEAAPSVVASAPPVASAPHRPKVLNSSGSAPREVAVPDGKVLIEEADLESLENAVRDDARNAALEEGAALEDAVLEDTALAEEGAALDDAAVEEEVIATEDVDGNELTSEDTDPSALRVFDAHLAPYGSWVEDAVFGRVWVPARTTVGEDFAPYVTAGRWTLSSAGHWIWLSDHPFGWVVFHYGRWVFSPALGWSWIPGRSYAPAWVVFRTAGYGDTYLGWAPLPPRYIWRSGRAVWLTHSPAAPYVFCPRLAAFEPQLPRYLVRQRDNAARLAMQSRRVRSAELVSRAQRSERDVFVRRATPTPRYQNERERRVFTQPLRTRLTTPGALRSANENAESRLPSLSTASRLRSANVETRPRSVALPQREKPKDAQRKLKVQRAAKARDAAASPRSPLRAAAAAKKSQAKAAQRKAKAKPSGAPPVRKPRKRS